MTLRAAELEVLLTANTDQIAQAEKQVQETGKRVESKPITAKVDADAKGALASIDRVEQQAKRLVSQKTLMTVEAKVDQAEKSLERTRDRLDYLRSIETELDVKADVARAEAQLQRTERQLEALNRARATMEVDADTSAASDAFDEVRSAAASSGEEAGAEFGDSIITALLSIPIAGALVGVGAAAAEALTASFEEGLQVDVGYDRLAALTGLSAADALRLGRAAGEAYANVFGESIEANMDVARLGVQLDLIDEDATTRDAQKVIEGLSGIADILGEDVQPVARAVAQMLRTGIAGSAREAFDILATGAREGVNVSEDLLDTFNEYSTQFRKLGLDGPQALGLISQALKGGARDSDIAADALKEFAVRVVDPAMRQGFADVGFSWDDLNRRITRGGPEAAAALDETLDRLRAIEDPALRDAAAIAIFGTQAEDMAAALTAMDLSTAVDELGGVEGAADRMFAALADNDATKLEQAKRNVEVAMQGIQGAIAAGFSDPLATAAEWVSQNRGPMLQFFLDLANGALDFGQSVVDGVAAGTEAFGDFVAGPLADLAKGLAGFVGFFDKESGEGLDKLAADMRDFDDTAAGAADTMRTNLTQAIDDARGRLNDFAEPAVALGYLNDASLRLADAISNVGSETGTMEDQVRAAVAALADEIEAADRAGEAQDELSKRYTDGTQALVDQMVQSGKTEEEARKLIDTILETPEEKSTAYSSNASEEQGKVQSLADRVETLPDGTIIIRADTGPADFSVEEFIRRNAGRRFTMYLDAIADNRVTGSGGGRGYTAQARGSVLEFMGAGGLTPMSPVAQVVPANTWRVVGDRMDVSESYIPHDGSARSLAILLETMRRFGIKPMADGGILGGGAGTLQAPGEVNLHFVMPPGLDPAALSRAIRWEIEEWMRGNR